MPAHENNKLFITPSSIVFFFKSYFSAAMAYFNLETYAPPEASFILSSYSWFF